VTIGMHQLRKRIIAVAPGLSVFWSERIGKIGPAPDRGTKFSNVVNVRSNLKSPRAENQWNGLLSSCCLAVAQRA
jgi:hypothetical protein